MCHTQIKLNVIFSNSAHMKTYKVVIYKKYIVGICFGTECCGQFFWEAIKKSKWDGSGLGIVEWIL